MSGVKCLGQVATLATTEAVLYTVPALLETVASSIIVCNLGSTTTTFRISDSVGGGATQNKDYIYYDSVIAGNNTFIATIGLTLAATDEIKVYAGNGNLSFSLFGKEQIA